MEEKDKLMKQFTRIIYVLALAAFCVPAPGQSESRANPWDAVKALAPGTEILIAPKGPEDVKGKVEAVTEDSIVVISGKRERTFLRGDIAWISVKENHRKKHVLSGLKWGAVIGAGAGGFVGVLCSEGSGGHAACWTGAIALGAGEVAGLGALLGTLRPGGGWREIYHQ
jgi:hypothetical protein